MTTTTIIIIVVVVVVVVVLVVVIIIVVVVVVVVVVEVCLKERNDVFNDALNTFYLQLFRIQKVKEKTCCSHFVGYSFQLAAMDILYTIPQTGQGIPWPLLHMFWNKKLLNGSTMRDWSDDTLHLQNNILFLCLNS